MLAWIEELARGDDRTAWIVRHGLRNLIKAGNQRALSIVGADNEPILDMSSLIITPKRICIGEAVTMTCTVKSNHSENQRLVMDYAIHYVRRGVSTRRKVFKLRILDLGSGSMQTIVHRKSFRELSTRRHYPGAHSVELLINGWPVADGSFELSWCGATVR
jgi:hypothetical protein